MPFFSSHLPFPVNYTLNPARPANMRFSPLSLSQFLSSILLLFHFHSTVSSPLSSNYSSSSHLCAHRQSLSLLQFKQSFSISEINIAVFTTFLHSQQRMPSIIWLPSQPSYCETLILL
jgi:hypothetical protein